jgi:hypothetical protein
VNFNQYPEFNYAVLFQSAPRHFQATSTGLIRMTPPKSEKTPFAQL